MLTYPRLLFQPKLRTNTDAIRENETTYAFLDRTAKDNADACRARANELYMRYPEGPEKQNLWKQITASPRHAFDEFFFELCVHGYLLDAGVRVVSIEPTLPGTSAKPDFLCEFNGKRFFVEVVTIHDEPEHRLQLERLTRDLRHLCKTGWAAHLYVVQYSDLETEPLRPTEIRKELREVIHQHRNETKYSHTVVRPGWELRFDLSQVGKKRSDFLGLTFYGTREVNLTSMIVKKIKRKVRKYERLPAPLIIAANLLGVTHSKLEHALDAMYGQDRLHPSFGKAISSAPDTVNCDSDRICRFASTTTRQLDSCLFFDNAGAWNPQHPSHVQIRNPTCLSEADIAIDGAPVVSLLQPTGQIVTSDSAKYPIGAHERWFHALKTPKP